MSTKLCCILRVGQSKQFGNQLFAFSLGDELGGRDCIDQHLELRQLIYMSIIVVLVLCRLIVLDMKATVMEHDKIIADRVTGDLKGIVFLEDLHQLSGR